MFKILFYRSFPLKNVIIYVATLATWPLKRVKQ
jgi:hypothetical protein